MSNNSNRIISNQTHHRSTNDRDNVEYTIVLFVVIFRKKIAMGCHQSSGNREPMTFIRLCILFKKADVIVTYANNRQELKTITEKCC